MCNSSWRARACATLALVAAVALPAAAQDSLVFRPLSGQWRYASTFEPAQIAGCAGVPAANRSTSGDAIVQAATDGSSLRIRLGGQELQFIRQGLTVVFRTFPRPFPVQTRGGAPASGSVDFEVRVDSPSALSGTTRWDNGQGCQAAYPFSLTLETAAEPPAVVPRAGRWAAVPLAALCADGLALFTMTLGGMTTITLDPVNSLTFSPPVPPPTHVTRTGPLFWSGPLTAIGMVSGAPRNFVGQVYLTFLEPTSALATFVGTSMLGDCTAGVQLTLAWVS